MGEQESVDCRANGTFNHSFVLTTGGAACQIPFSYDETTYTACTVAEDNDCLRWCDTVYRYTPLWSQLG